jgi:UDP-glucuronate 4-epimerase
VSLVVLVTGVAGLIGSHVAEALLARGDAVVGLDNFNDYYSPARKRANLAEVERGAPPGARLRTVEGDVRDRALVARLFAEEHFDAVVHLAALAGIRASVARPAEYYDVNVQGTLALLDAAVGREPPQSIVEGAGAAPAEPGEQASVASETRPPADARLPAPRFILGSTSSVYGASQQLPFSEADPCDRPLVPYAASKRAAELLGHTYHHLYGLQFTALRFFTVYGPRSRPDMMAYKVAESIYRDEAVPLHNGGQMHRDWTFVDDIGRGIVAAVDRPLGYEVINLGRGQPVLLADFVRLIERGTGRQARLVPTPMPDADMPSTWADIGKARRLLGYEPSVSVEEGVARFLAWYERAVRQDSTLATEA